MNNNLENLTEEELALFSTELKIVEDLDNEAETSTSLLEFQAKLEAQFDMEFGSKYEFGLFPNPADIN